MINPSNTLIIITFLFSSLVAQAAQLNKNGDSHAKYPATIELSMKGGNKRSIARPGALFPIYQTSDSITYINVITMFDSIHSIEGNFGVGYRAFLNSKNIFGMFAHHDVRRSPTGKIYHQETIGLEWFRKYAEIRTNVYIPRSKQTNISDDKHIKPRVNLASRKAIVDFTREQLVECPLGGFDVEVGSVLPFKKIKKLSFHLGYYLFGALNKDAKTIKGWRARANLEINRAISLNAEASHDNERKMVYFAGATLTYEFGSSNRSSSLTTLERKMTQMPVRDIDIVLGEGRKTTLLDSIEGPFNSKFAVVPLDGGQNDECIFHHGRGEFSTLPAEDIENAFKGEETVSILTLSNGRFGFAQSKRLKRDVPEAQYKQEKQALMTLAKKDFGKKIKVISAKESRELLKTPNGRFVIAAVRESSRRLNTLPVEVNQKVEQEGKEFLLDLTDKNARALSVSERLLAKALKQHARMIRMMSSEDGLELLNVDGSDESSVAVHNKAFAKRREAVKKRRSSTIRDFTPASATTHSSTASRRSSPPIAPPLAPSLAPSLAPAPPLAPPLPQSFGRSTPASQPKPELTREEIALLTLGKKELNDDQRKIAAEREKERQKLEKLRSKRKIDFSKMTGNMFAGAKRLKRRKRKSLTAEQLAKKMAAAQARNAKGSNPTICEKGIPKQLTNKDMIYTAGRDAVLFYNRSPVIIDVAQYQTKEYGYKSTSGSDKNWYLKATTYAADTGGYWKYNGDESSISRYMSPANIRKIQQGRGLAFR